jgi:transcriptional regulator with XRE-family HTH domain/predicted transcriptional regulator
MAPDDVTTTTRPERSAAPDPLDLGRRIRARRVERGMSLQEFADRLGKAPSRVSVIENGQRDLRLGELQRIAEALGTTPEALYQRGELSERDALEVEFLRAQRTPLYASLGLPEIPVRKSLSDDVMRTQLKLLGELTQLHSSRAATPEVARRANLKLRAEQRERGNYFAELEHEAQAILSAIGYRDGPVSMDTVKRIAGHLGFTLHAVDDLPHTTKSITDSERMRVYLPASGVNESRSVVLQALAAYVLDKREPVDYGDLLQQRVETNYFAGAILLPEVSAVPLLRTAKQRRDLSIEEFSGHYGVTYETAAHRFSNLATQHLEIPVHFLKVHASGTLLKAYENDAVQFPTDALGNVEGQIVCRWWSARQVFTTDERIGTYSQYTDKPAGSYWCTSQVEPGPGGGYSISVGTKFSEAKWFRGRDTDVRLRSDCPDPSCCREPDPELVERWGDHAWPSARLNSSLLAAMPSGTFTGVDRVAVLEFLQRHP